MSSVHDFTKPRPLSDEQIRALFWLAKPIEVRKPILTRTFRALASRSLAREVKRLPSNGGEQIWLWELTQSGRDMIAAIVEACGWPADDLICGGSLGFVRGDP